MQGLAHLDDLRHATTIPAVAIIADAALATATVTIAIATIAIAIATITLATTTVTLATVSGPGARRYRVLGRVRTARGRLPRVLW